MTTKIIAKDHELQAEFQHHSDAMGNLHFQNYTGTLTVDIQIGNDRIVLTEQEARDIMAKFELYKIAEAIVHSGNSDQKAAYRIGSDE